MTRLAARGWLRTEPSREPVRQRLVCLPHAGGTARAFAGWSRDLPPDVEVVAVQYPGRQDRIREPFVTRMSELADLIATELGSLPAVATTIFGHSMGSAVGYEVALRLQETDGQPVRRLVVSARTTPHRRCGEPNHRLADDALAGAMIALGGVDSGIYANARLWPAILPPIRADLSLLDGHRPTSVSTLRCPITAFGAADDTTCSIDELAAWRELTEAQFTLQMFPGGHHYLAVDQAAVLAALAGLLTGPAS